MTDQEETKTSKSKPMNVTCNLKSRFYEKIYPEVEEFVMVEIKDVGDNGAYAKLLEYNDIEGMIAPNEYTTVRMKSINKLFKVGTQEAVMVLRVDAEKGYIDLSKKKASPEDTNQCKERFRQAKVVNTVLRTIAEKTNTDLEKLYQEIGWPLDKKFGSSYEAFRIGVMDPERIFSEIKVDENLREKLITEITRRLAPQKLKIRADFEITCFSYEGIDGIKEALREGRKKSNQNVELLFQVLSAPIYMAIANTPDKNEGIKVMKEALEIVEAKIKEKKGGYLLKEEPKVVGDKGDKDIQEMIKALEQKQMDSDEENSEGYVDVEVEGDEDNQAKAEDDDDDDDDDEEEEKTA